MLFTHIHKIFSRISQKCYLKCEIKTCQIPQTVTDDARIGENIITNKINKYLYIFLYQKILTSQIKKEKMKMSEKNDNFTKKEYIKRDII